MILTTRLSKNFWEICECCVVVHKLTTNATRIVIQNSDHHNPLFSSVLLPDSEFVGSTMLALWIRKILYVPFLTSLKESNRPP